jgi:hypothetical protein
VEKMWCTHIWKWKTEIVLRRKPDKYTWKKQSGKFLLVDMFVTLMLPKI